MAIGIPHLPRAEAGEDMLDGPTLVRALLTCNVTHVVWLPDSHLGQWESALRSEPGLQLVRVAREGEAIALAGGLLLGGKRPIVAIQCTGLFEAGDALRNMVHDLKLPLFMLVGVRSQLAYQRGQSNDTCPVFTVPILEAWQLPYTWLPETAAADDLVALYRKAEASGKPQAVLLSE
jgi:sulfopyruvate decarboxylase TPP-binding subunit